MHISEGVLSAPTLAVGAALTLGGLYLGLKKLPQDQLPKVALLSAVFFVASNIHVPVGVSSAHLILNGLAGILLGWAAFPAIFVGLVLQAILFQFGGLIVLGVNTATMALPGVICYYAFSPLLARQNRTWTLLAGFASGFTAVLLAGCLVSLSLYASNRDFLQTAQAVLLAHVPIMIVEGVITALTLGFLAQVQPRLLSPKGIVS